MERIAQQINLLARFCGMRDFVRLTPESMEAGCGVRQADVMVLFGGSILCGADVLAEAMRQGLARHYGIVGGEGHTTEALRRRARQEFPGLETEGLPEAQVFAACLKRKYGLEADFLECASTNCGNNITGLINLLAERGISFRNILLVQDASMQRRMDAGMRKYAADVQIINYAAYAAEVAVEGGRLVFREEIPGMWDMERWISLLLGEIPRLSDDAEGYGPRGKGFIAHVEVPEEVRRAFEELREHYAGLVRAANPLYASKQ